MAIPSSTALPGPRAGVVTPRVSFKVLEAASPRSPTVAVGTCARFRAACDQLAQAVARFNAWVSVIHAAPSLFQPNVSWQQRFQLGVLHVIAAGLLVLRTVGRVSRTMHSPSRGHFVVNFVLGCTNIIFAIVGFVLARAGKGALLYANKDADHKRNMPGRPRDVGLGDVEMPVLPTDPHRRRADHSSAHPAPLAAPAAQDRNDASANEPGVETLEQPPGTWQQQRLAIVRLVLASSFVAAAVCCGIFASIDVADNRAGKLSEGELVWELMWELTGMLCVTAPMVAIAEMLSALALRTASRIRDVAEQLPRLPYDTVAQQLRGEEENMKEQMHSWRVSVLVLMMMASMVFSVCNTALLISEGRPLGLLILDVVDSIAFIVPAMTTMVQVAEVTDGWVKIPYAIMNEPVGSDSQSETVGADSPHQQPRWHKLGTQWMDRRQRNELGVKAFEVHITKKLAVAWLGLAGTVLGVLLRLNALHRGGVDATVMPVMH